MKLSSTGAPLTAAGISAACKLLGVTPAALWAVIEVETNGAGFLADRRLKALFERHKFRAATAGKYDKTHPEISSARAGGYMGGADEYFRIEAAMALDEDAALRSTSWGLPQIMGFNHEVAGYASARAMVAAFQTGEDAQIAAMARFIKATCVDALRDRDWPAFARSYNGPAYAQNNYAQRLAAAYARATASEPDLDLRAAQIGLTYLGHKPGTIDGKPGPKTAAAIAAFQTSRGMSATGSLDALTQSRIAETAFGASTGPTPADHPFAVLIELLITLFKRSS